MGGRNNYVTGAYMKIGYLAASVAALALLAGCGGGSGGVNSTPTPQPVPPAPSPPTTNTTLADLQVSQSFVNDAATLKGTWDVATGTAIDGASKAATLSIRYDAGAGSYTLVTDARNEAFNASNIIRQNDYDTMRQRLDGSHSEHLTLVKLSYSAQTGEKAEKYVAMGFWQSSNRADNLQSTEFTIFNYGLPTASTMVPRTGAAAYEIDLFGLVTKPSEEPMYFQGAGKFSVDFAQGLFTTQASAEEYGLNAEWRRTGSGIELRAGGSLSAGTGTFAGNAVYGSSYGEAWGSITGRFYGPNGEELGATFHTANDAGMTAVGSIVGSQDATQKPDSQTLTALMSEHAFRTLGGGILTWFDAETFDYDAGDPNMIAGRFTANEKIAGRNANFVTYAKSGDVGHGPQQAVMELYKAGSANTELALTYASFGHWSGPLEGSVQDRYFAYGFTTGYNFLRAHTGTARYEGVAYATGRNSDNSTLYDLKGTSRIDVDFGTQAFTGAFALSGTEKISETSVDLGSFDIHGPLITATPAIAGYIRRDTTDVGSLVARFYGADAQEVAGPFSLLAPAGTVEAKDVFIQGAIAAARQ